MLMNQVLYFQERTTSTRTNRHQQVDYSTNGLRNTILVVDAKIPKRYPFTSVRTKLIGVMCAIP